jgi:hypothetical protein
MSPPPANFGGLRSLGRAGRLGASGLRSLHFVPPCIRPDIPARQFYHSFRRRRRRLPPAAAVGSRRVTAQTLARRAVRACGAPQAPPPPSFRMCSALSGTCRVLSRARRPSEWRGALVEPRAGAPMRVVRCLDPSASKVARYEECDRERGGGGPARCLWRRRAGPAGLPPSCLIREVIDLAAGAGIVGGVFI